MAKLDVKVTAVLAQLLPAPLLYFPAHCFGVPLTALCAIPSTLPLVLDANLGDKSSLRFILVASFGIVGGALIPLFLVQQGKFSADRTFHKGAHIPAGCVCVLLGLRLVHSMAFAAACLYLVTFMHVAALTWLLKGFVARPRPALCLDVARRATAPQGLGVASASSDEALHLTSQLTPNPRSSRRKSSFDRSSSSSSGSGSRRRLGSREQVPLSALTREQLVAAAQEAEEEAAAERQKAVATEGVAATCAARDAAAAAVSPLETPSWLLRTYMSRKARFPHAVGSLTHAPNSLHSFPSFDAAAAGCLVGAILKVSSADGYSAGGGVWLITTWCALAMLGRVAFFAHHLLDVLGGFALGLAFSSAFGGLLEPAEYPYLLLWAPAAPLLTAAFFTARPLLLAAAVVVIAAILLSAPYPSCLALPCAFGALVGAVTVAFRAQCRRQHSYALRNVEAFWATPGARPPSGLLTPSLLGMMRRKRELVRTQAERPLEALAFPANLYMIGRFYRLPFGATWDSLEALMRRRLLDWAVVTGISLDRFDVLVGVCTGGALLAPLCARILAIPSVCSVRVSRYEDDLYSPYGLTKVVVSQLLGSHEERYVLSDTPDEATLRGKRVLIVDDALASGGTMRAVHSFCARAGATSVDAVALKIIGGYVGAEDFLSARGKRGPRRHAARELHLPTFTPWGTF